MRGDQTISSQQLDHFYYMVGLYTCLEGLSTVSSNSFPSHVPSLVSLCYANTKHLEKYQWCSLAMDLFICKGICLYRLGGFEERTQTTHRCNWTRLSRAVLRSTPRAAWIGKKYGLAPGASTRCTTWWKQETSAGADSFSFIVQGKGGFFLFENLSCRGGTVRCHAYGASGGTKHQRGDCIIKEFFDLMTFEWGLGFVYIV